MSIDGDRTIRIEVLEGGEIEIIRVSTDGKSRSPLYYDNETAALVVIEMFLSAAIKKAVDNKFESQLNKEARKEFRKLESEFHGKTKGQP